MLQCTNDLADNLSSVERKVILITRGILQSEPNGLRRLVSMLKHAIALVWAAFVVTFLVFCLVPSGQRFACAPLSAGVFAAVLTCFPRCRPVVETPLCPWNWALFLFFLQLTGMPLLIMLDGPALTYLPYLPSAFATNVAMGVYSLGFLVVSATYSHFSKFRACNGSWLDSIRNWPDQKVVGSRTRITVYFIIGAFGVFLAFGSFSGILDYFNNPTAYHDSYLDSSSTWQGVGAIVLKQFLGFAVVMAWCKWIDSGGAKSSLFRRVVVTVAALAAILTSFSMFNFNRASLAVPLVSIATLTLVKGDKLSRRTMIVSSMLVLFLMPIFVLYREGIPVMDVPLRNKVADSVREEIRASAVAQMYGGAPQYLGFLLERSRWGSDPYWGEVTASSILSPLPILGKPFRRHSGFGIFNQMIYGTDAILDQNVPFQGEWFLDFNVLGVLFGSAIFGWVLHRLQGAFERSRSSIEIYIWQYLSVWTCFLIFGFGGIGVQSQVMIYYCWPIYGLWWLNKRSRSHLQVKFFKADFEDPTHS